jgi:protein-L-isoaspartate(D-aspartate) O-methyltransferase
MSGRHTPARNGTKSMNKDAEALNEAMVARLVGDAHVRSPRIERAFRSVLRHWFLREVALERVYSGTSIVIAHGKDGLATSSSSEPGIMAVMLEQLGAQSEERVLEVGTGSGYNTALLAALVGDSGSVTTVDIDHEVSVRARHSLRRAGLEAVSVIAGDGWLGAPERAPYNRIEVTVGVWDLSPEWVQQLKLGGVLVVPLWLKAGVQASVALLKREGALVSLSVEPCGFMRLRGAHAGPESYFALDGWAACLDDASSTQKDLLTRLVATKPVERAIASPVHGWFERLVFEEPSAVQMWTTDEAWPRSRQGLLLSQPEGLALVEGETLLAYGDAEAGDRLATWLRRRRGLSLSNLSVEAISADEDAPRGDGWLLRRPNFGFRLREEAPRREE